MNSKKRIFEFKKIENRPAGFGMTQQTESVLASVFGLFFMLAETKNVFVRYCAIMSVFIWSAWMLGFFIFSVLASFPFIGFVFELLRALLSIGASAFLIFMAVNAYNGKKVIVAGISGFADQWSRPDI
jgi:uncharacterized membrane protein